MTDSVGKSFTVCTRGKILFKLNIKDIQIHTSFYPIQTRPKLNVRETLLCAFNLGFRFNKLFLCYYLNMSVRLFNIFIEAATHKGPLKCCGENLAGFTGHCGSLFVQNNVHRCSCLLVILYKLKPYHSFFVIFFNLHLKSSQSIFKIHWPAFI